jgi:hypothetical protein
MPIDGWQRWVAAMTVFVTTKTAGGMVVEVVA